MEIAAVLLAIILLILALLIKQLVILVLLYLTTNTIVFFALLQLVAENGAFTSVGLVTAIVVIYWLVMVTVLLVRITPRWEKRLARAKSASDVRLY